MATSHIDVLIISVAVIIPLIAIQIKYDTLCKIQNHTMSFNLTEKFRKDHNENILIFARVPKTASLTINALLERLTDKNNFAAFSVIDGMPAENDNVCLFPYLFNCFLLNK